MELITSVEIEVKPISGRSYTVEGELYWEVVVDEIDEGAEIGASFTRLEFELGEEVKDISLDRLSKDTKIQQLSLAREISNIIEIGRIVINAGDTIEDLESIAIDISLFGSRFRYIYIY